MMDASPDGKWFAAGGGYVDIWDTELGEAAHRLDVQMGDWRKYEYCHASFSSDDKSLLVLEGSEWNTERMVGSIIQTCQDVRVR